MTGWLQTATIGITGDIPVAEMKSLVPAAGGVAHKKNLRLKGARWTQVSTAASSGAVVGSCILQFGNSSGNLSSIVVGHGSSLGGQAVELSDDGGLLSAKCVRATFGAGSSVCGPLTVTIWGDYGD